MVGVLNQATANIVFPPENNFKFEGERYQNGKFSPQKYPR